MIKQVHKNVYENWKGGHWLEPCEECYYYIKKWKNEGRHRISKVW